MRTFFQALLGFLLLVGLAVGGLVWSITGNVATQAGRVISKTIDADNVLANYEWFKRQYEDIRGMEPKLQSAQSSLNSFMQSAGPRSAWTFEDKQEASRLNSVILGLTNQRVGMINEYNARTQMANRNIFRTGDLPETIATTRTGDF
jgi:hypothetical protein